MAELKPCPFCGGAATLFQIPENTEEEQCLHPKWKWRNQGLWVIGCETDMCICNYNNEAMLFMTADSAVKAWNRRANDG